MTGPNEAVPPVDQSGTFVGDPDALRGVAVELARMGLGQPSAPDGRAKTGAEAGEGSATADNANLVPTDVERTGVPREASTSSLPLADPYRSGPPGARLRARAMTTGSVLLGGAAAARRELTVAHRVNAPLRSALTVAFMSAKGGTGCTTTALGVGVTLAATRSDRVALVGGAVTDQSLSWRLAAGRRAPNVLEVLAAKEPTGEFLRPLVHDLSVAEGPPAVRPLTTMELSSVLGRMADHHSVVLVDLGTDTGLAQSTVLSAAGAVVVVTDDTPVSLRATSELLLRLGMKSSAAWHERVAVAVTGTHRRGLNRAAVRDFIELTEQRHGRRRPTFRVAYDRVLALGEPLRVEAIAPEVRRAYLELAADLVVPRTSRATG